MKIGDLEIPRAIVVLGSVLALNVLILWLFFKEIRLVCFDPDLARTLGIPADLIHLGLMALVAFTTAAAFELVGSIMVVALLVVPAACCGPIGCCLCCSWLLPLVCWWVCGVRPRRGLASCATGVPIKPSSETRSPGGWLLLVVDVCGNWMFALQQGLFLQWLRRYRLRRIQVQEDVIGLLYRLDEVPERERPEVVVGMIATALHIAPRAVRSAWLRRSRGLVLSAGEAWQLGVGSARMTTTGALAPFVEAYLQALWSARGPSARASSPS